MTTVTESAVSFELIPGAVIAPSLLPELSSQPQSLIFIDQTLDDIDTLVSHLEASAVVLIAPTADGISEITRTLAQYQQLDSVHIFSHGAAGQLALGNAVLSTDMIATQTQTLASWGKAFSENGDLFFYGCNLAAGETGAAFVEQISQLTGADVAASSDLTGALGDWQLEVTTGSIEAAIALDAAGQAAFTETLALLDNGGFEAGLTSWVGFTGQETTATTQPFAGTASLSLQLANAGVAQNVSAIAGETYTLSGQAQSSSSGYSALGLTFFDAAFNFLSTAASSAISTPTWQPYQVETIAPTGTAFVQAWTYKGTNDGTVLIDALTLTSGTQPPLPDTTPPVANITTTAVTIAGASNYEFTVAYTDNTAINVSTLDNTDLQVTGPNGFNQFASLVSVNNNTNGTPRTTTYRINAPGGSWDNADNGAYAIALQPNAVTDTNNNAAAVVSKDFTVNISPSTGVTEQLINGSFESELTNWIGFSGQETVSSTQSFVGSKALELTNTDAGIAQNFAANAGKTYTLSGYAKSLSTDYSAFGVTFFDTNYNFLSQSSTAPINSSAWQPYQVVATAPVNTAFAQVWTYKGGNNGSVLMDGLSLTVPTTLPNQPPVITSDGGGDTATINLNEGITTVTDVAVSDSNGDTEGNGITYSLNGGADQALFTVNANTGVLAFRQAPDYENPADTDRNNVYFASVLATDSTGLTDSQFMAIVVNNVQEAGNPPIITSNGGGDTAIINLNEGISLVTDVNITDADGDREGNGITYSINDGADRSLFTIDPQTGVLNFAIAPDFEAPSDADQNNVYFVNVLATDSAGLSDSQFMAVVISNLPNDAPPIITSNGGGSIANLTVAENTTAVTNLNATDADGDTEGLGLLYSITGPDVGKFNINPATGVLAFNTVPDFEQPTDSNQDNTYTLAVTVTDSTSLQDTQTLNVSVTDVQEAAAPVIISNGGGDLATIALVEGSTLVTTVAARDSNSDLLTYAIRPIAGDDSALFQINASTGQLSFRTPPDFENPTDQDRNNSYVVVVEVSDPGGLTDSQIITVNITDTVEALPPIISSNGGGDLATVGITEGTTIVTTVTATDANSDPITYAIKPVTGDDSALFQINPSTGQLSFRTPPDFENPTDQGRNNSYVVVVEAKDPGGLTDTQIITVNVSNVNEVLPPVITSNGGGATADVAVIEGTATVTTVTATDGDAGDTITYSIQSSAGDDAARFQINPTTGQLSFSTPPDFETPTDGDANNIYRVTVAARDPGGLTDTQTLTVSVTNAVSVFLLGGQSNIVGQGLNAELPPDLAAPYANVKIWQFGTQSFINLQPGFAGWSGELNEFGPEVTFGRGIQGKTAEEVYLIKYGLGATNLAVDWNPNGDSNQHDIFVSRVNSGLAKLSSQNIAYTVEGLLWMQGENDAFESAQYANAYEANLTAFIADMRSRYNPNLKFVVGRIHDDLPPAGYLYDDTVRAAQDAVAALDPLTYIVNTDSYSLKPDSVHFDTAGQIALGYGFAAAL